MPFGSEGMSPFDVGRQYGPLAVSPMPFGSEGMSPDSKAYLIAEEIALSPMPFGSEGMSPIIGDGGELNGADVVTNAFRQ